MPAPVSVEIGEMMALLGIAQATRRKEHEGEREEEVGHLRFGWGEGPPDLEGPLLKRGLEGIEGLSCN